MTWIAPDVERSEDYPARRNEPEREMLRDWLEWHRATLLRKCAGLDATRLAKRAVPPSNLSLLGLVRHLSDAERGWVRQVFRGEQIPDMYYRSDAPDADFEEEYLAVLRRTSSATGPSAGPSMPRWRARSWTTRSRSRRRPPRCDGCGSTSWRSTRATTGTPTCSARPSTARPGCAAGPRVRGRPGSGGSGPTEVGPARARPGQGADLDMSERHADEPGCPPRAAATW